MKRYLTDSRDGSRRRHASMDRVLVLILKSPRDLLYILLAPGE